MFETLRFKIKEEFYMTDPLRQPSNSSTITSPFLEELKTLLRSRPSPQTRFGQDMQKTADWIADHFRSLGLEQGDDLQICRTPDRLC
jgi:hypothetical protein